jgi:uncharacterized Fe-S center protein
MKKEVFLVESKNDLGKLWESLKPKLKKPVAIKTHFGEKGNITYPNPKLVKFFAGKLKNPTLIESNTLYKGERSKASTHKKLAIQHGFDFAPIDICDGENGDKEIGIKINLKYFKIAKIGTNIKKYNSILSIAHFKGHGASGFGGAIKNIGMGLASRSGKLKLHSEIAPAVNKNKCRACGLCVKNCPANAITLKKKAEINPKKCIGCAKCIAVCPYKAIKIPWHGVTNKEFQERLVEYCYAVLKNRDSSFINFLVNITKECDCIAKKMKPFIKDIGYLASDDPVALDKACFDLVKKEYGKDPFRKFHHVNSVHQFKYAEKIGLGKTKYKLIRL